MKKYVASILLLLGTMIFVACAPVAPTAAPVANPPSTGKFDWKKYQGTTLRVFFWENKQVDEWLKKLPEFEQLTGIKVTYEKHTVGETYQKTLLELTTNPDKVDMFIFFPHQQKYKFVKEGFQQDLNPYLKNPELTNPDFNMVDFFEAQVNGLTVDGKLIGAHP